VRPALRDKFLEVLAGFGGSAGNGRLLVELGWQEDTYARVRDELAEEGLIIRGRGRGGSVALAEVKAATKASKPPKQAARNAKSKRAPGGFDQTFNALDKVLRNEAGQTTALPPISRAERVETRKSTVLHGYDSALASFLDFVLGQYVAQGVDELDQDKLPRLLELRFASVSEGAQALGGVPAVRTAFIDCQRGLFTSNST